MSTTVTIPADTTNFGYLDFEDANYAKVLDGTAATKNVDTVSQQYIGQGISGGIRGNVEAALSFDTTSIPTIAIIHDVRLYVVALGGGPVTNFEIQVVPWDYGAALTTSDYLTQAMVTPLPVLGSYSTASGWVNGDGYNLLQNGQNFADAIVKGGITRLGLISDKFRAGIDPTTSDLVVIYPPTNAMYYSRMVIEYSLPQDITPEELAALQAEQTIAEALSGVRGPVVTRHRFEWRTLGFDFVADITEAVDAMTGSVELDNNRAVVRTASLKIYPDSLPSNFDEDHDHIAIFQDLMIDGTWESFSLGLYRIDEYRDVSRPNARRHWEASLAGVSTHLFEYEIDQPYVLPAGSLYTDAAAALVEACGLANNIFPSTLTTPIPLAWPIGSSRGQIVNDLMEGINYFDVWSDAQGRICSRERVNPMLENIAVDYTTAEEPRMIRPDFYDTHTNARATNRCICSIKTAARAPSSIRATNDYPDSAVSTVAKGSISAEDITADRMASVQIMEDSAEYAVRDAAVKAHQGSLSTHPDPRREAHEFYLLTIEDVEIETRWRCESWRLDLRPGATMEHTIGHCEEFPVTIEVLV